MPAIYDLKPTFLNVPPFTFGQGTQDIIDALIFEADQLQADSLTAAYDIYNIEAEAVGCSVLRDPRLPMPEIERPIISSLDALEDLGRIEGTAGRMEIFVQGAVHMLQRYGGRIPVRGGVSGPFTMATRIYPKDTLLMETVMNPEKTIPLLRFCTNTIKTYAKAFADTGSGVVVFDSFVSPPMLSPEIYRDLVLPFHREIFQFLENLGVEQRTLIIGGDTLPLIPEIFSTGATQFLLDFTIPLEAARDVLQEYPDRVFRVNLPPSAFRPQYSGDLSDIVNRTLQSLKDCPNLIMGTGILPIDALPERILAAKRQIIEFYN
jgi:uroporphyrinogen decarboxylase